MTSEANSDRTKLSVREARTDSPTTGQSALQQETPAAFASFDTLDTLRMAALAQIAGKIAPALSDSLTVIRGHAGWLLDHADPAAATQEPLNQIYTAAEKAGGLLRQLLIFSRQQTKQAGALDLNGLIRETASVLNRLLGSNIHQEFHLADNLPLVVADPDMMEQLIIILAQNARDAMPTGGRLLFKTEAADTVGESATGGSEGMEMKFVTLSVEDTGHGISPEILPQVFEPFFTTKAGGTNTGLGLATVFGIVKQHHGWLAVESAVNGGTRFKITLPAAPTNVIAGARAGAETRNRKGNETILLVEDDAAVRELTVFILHGQGYRVLQAGSGPDALEVWKWHASRIRLLLTDMVLEDHMTGLELATKLRAEDPRLKVICTSGHQRDDMECFAELAGDYHFLQKPCRPKTLLSTVRALLDEKHL